MQDISELAYPIARIFLPSSESKPAPMPILQIEHKVQNFDNWKKAFETDPIGRKKSGVKHHRIYRPADEPNYVIIDLEFDGMQELQSTLVALNILWGKVEGSVIFKPQTRILNLVETTDYE